MKTYSFILSVILSLTACTRETQEKAPAPVAGSSAGSKVVEAKKVVRYWWVPTTYEDFRIAYLRSSGKGC